MKNISINLPDIYIDLLKEIGEKKAVSRSELIRQAISDFLKEERNLLILIKELHSKFDFDLTKEAEEQLKSEIQKRIEHEFGVRLKSNSQKRLEGYSEFDNKETSKLKDYKFFNYCIICDRRLHSKENYQKILNVEVFNVRFCCACFKKYKIKILKKIPENLITLILKKMDMFQKHKKGDTTS